MPVSGVDGAEHPRHRPVLIDVHKFEVDVMRLPISLLFITVLSLPAFGDEVPFAAPSPSRLGTQSQVYYASLADIMSLTQMRHIKLWHAGSAGNWGLASFEIMQLRDTFARAAMFYDGLPIENVMSIEKPLDAIAIATKAKDPVAFAQGFSSLTTACNECHRAAGVSFIAIIMPTTSPFTDERF